MKASFRSLLNRYGLTEPLWLGDAIHFVDTYMENDGGHDWGHLYRVLEQALLIAKSLEKIAVDFDVLIAAVLFHDIVNLPKNAPNRKEASKLSGDKAVVFFSPYFSPEEILKLRNAIEAHSFSAQIDPRTVEAKIVQDADRLESTGALGLARTFYTSGRMSGELFHPEDPFGAERELDDRRYAVDHFYKKILSLPESMHTEKAKSIASHRNRLIEVFLKELQDELNP